MSGGSWLTQNKIRPGAYINFKGVAGPPVTLGSRGVVTLPVPMSWGAQVTEVLSIDLATGNTLEKLGCVVTDAEAQIFREALKNCYKGIFYRVDTGGAKATATVGNLIPVAKYAGVVGNRITITIVSKDSKFDVYTLVDGIEKDKQVGLTNAEDVQDNAWVDFGGTGVLAANAGTPLTGGTNGTVSDANYTDYLNTISSYNWNTMGIPVDNNTVATAVETFIKLQRDTYGKKVQAVLYNYSADYEGIISVDQGYKTVDETVAATTFVAYVAGLTAGSEANISNTYHTIPGAVEIISPKTETEIEQALLNGKLILTTRIDGVIVIEQDINTLHTFTKDKPYAFSKNRVMRTLDGINNDISLIFQKSYIGKMDNNDFGRNLFKSAIIQYINTLQSINSVQNFDGKNDVTVLPGEAIDAVVVDLNIQPVDAMEKLYMTVYVQ